ncbi:MAG: cytochrome c4 [Burkholderiales bacterium]|nr:cytochrome c4 [Burkholderiales bacterium]MDE2288598.1 cytochrome c4 [Burkholderiales bacterium]MDE2609395.1 cytochrome c4 [Burkholderiales bacterium]
MKNTFASRLLMTAMLAAAGLASTATLSYAQNGEKLAQQLCASCHGPGGHSESPMFPRLAGQTQEYIENQLNSFHNHARGETDARSYMWAMASQLDDATIKSLAEYYSHQTPSPGTPGGDPALIAKGDDIFHHGVPSAGVPACASCHGAEAQGMGQFPRLAGQHEGYLLRQLGVFKNGTRANAPMMTAVAHALNGEEAQAVAAYLHSK